MVVIIINFYLSFQKYPLIRAKNFWYLMIIILISFKPKYSVVESSSLFYIFAYLNFG